MAPGPYRRLAALQIATGIGVILFWTAFFTVGLAPSSPPPGYMEFEHAFPFPDILLALGLFRAAALLRHAAAERRRQGVALSLVCAGALLFLGVLDFSFNIQNGMYTISAADGVQSALVQAWCIGFGLYLIWRCGGPTAKDGR